MKKGSPEMRISFRHCFIQDGSVLVVLVLDLWKRIRAAEDKITFGML